MKLPLLGYFWAHSPQIWLKFAKILTRGSSLIRQRVCVNKFSKLSVKVETGCYQSWQIWSIFYDQYTPPPPPNQNFKETTCLWLSNNESPRCQINHRIPIKLIKKPFLGLKNGLFKVKNKQANKDQEVRDQVSTTFSEAPNSGLAVRGKLFVVAQLNLAF